MDLSAHRTFFPFVSVISDVLRPRKVAAFLEVVDVWLSLCIVYCIDYITIDSCGNSDELGKLTIVFQNVPEPT